MKGGVNWTFDQIEIVNVNVSLNFLSVVYQLASNFQKAHIENIYAIVPNNIHTRFKRSKT